MIEAQGWISISLLEHEEETTSLENVIVKINELVKPFKQFNQYFEVRSMNGSYVLFIGLNHNHNISYDKDVYNLLKEIGKIANGSYGSVYMRFHDDEYKNNEFQIYKLARGQVSVEKDNLLSPCNPTIEF